MSGHDLRRAGDRRRAPAVRSRGADLPAAGCRLSATGECAPREAAPRAAPPLRPSTHPVT
ncbi:hypothetical protein BP3921G_41970 [Burkholderia pseudomallei]|nr:hypothetical protein BP3921G_41970 [Burkholderia pseudomallei]